MLINSIDLSSLGIKLYDRVITSNSVATKEAWLDGDIQPTHIRQQDGFKNITLSFLILGQDEDDAFLKISKLTQLLKKATLKFDDLDYMFDVSMIGKANPERLKNGNFIVKYEFTSDYAKGEREIYTTNANLTNAFKLTVLYYQNSTTLLATESVTLRASAFEDTNNTLASIGINPDKYRPNYYKEGVATNLGNHELTYENLQQMGTLIINYAPIVYNLSVQYFMDSGTGIYQDLLETTVNFTYPQLLKAQSIGQIVDVKGYKPEGYSGKISFSGELTVENLLASAPIHVFYDRVENDLSKNVTITYSKENDDGSYSVIGGSTAVFKQSEFTDGMILGDILNIDAYRPSTTYYNTGYLIDHAVTELISYDSLEASYEIRYSKMVNTIFVEYYIGVYPGWYRVTTATLATTYKDSYEDSFSISDIGLDLDKYHTSEYYPGVLYNGDIYDSYEAIVSSGVLQVFYRPIDYTIKVQYSVPGSNPTVEDVVINALDFLGNPVLSDIIPISAHRPDGYQFDSLLSYDGPVTLSALTQASPIVIQYEEIQEARTKNIILKYKQELSSTFATINTSIITVNEADCIGGIRLKDIFNMNLYKPDYYENGILDGFSSTALIDFDAIESTYTIIYMASSYITPVRYYTDDIDDRNWVGSSSISYKVIDFTTETTLYDLGLNVNAYKPSYCDDGVLDYNGPINFQALRELESLNVVYDTIVEPGEDEFDYPHRFLFLEHNDLGDYESLHPNWTMNHAYINTGVSAEDMSKLTVIMECARVDENVPLHNVNAGYGYLFGSSSVLGSYFMRFNNQTQYGNNLTGVNTYEAQAGLHSDTLVLSESSAIGFSENSGIYSIERPGYSQAVFTYTNTMASENAQMPYPIYLFANNNAGQYEGGLAGIGIYGCRIYYGGTLIRDFIPVQFYDKIGEKIAPSNCLYDKITGNFFEDATGQNSFNIIDDDRYTDTNLDHKIGHCYVNYYKGDVFIQNVAYYFRASDFVDKVLDPYEKFQVDLYQPAYYKSGEIVDFKDKIWDFDNMNNAVYTVIYPEQENSITVRYYSEAENGVRTLIQEETRGISEKEFYQSPTFGDLVRINKYKPDGYETDFEYAGSKVSLARVVENSPYEIVYKKANRELQTYSTIIRYIKKVYGIRVYETIGTKTLTFDETMFRDGEYIDFFIDKNEFKPEKYYLDGETYQWYEMDERLTTPAMLKASYTIVYQPETQYLNVNYYTDEIHEDNLIASTTWGVNIDTFEPGYDIYLIDTLPNEYINKYKPANCNGGQLQNPEKAFKTFDELASIPEIAIVYETKSEPHDPENASWEQKVLYWGMIDNDDYSSDINGMEHWRGGQIPFIDLGYKPKEISRLRVEIKGYARPWGISAQTSSYGFQDMGYTYYFGYYAPKDISTLGFDEAIGVQTNNSISANGTGRGSSYSPNSTGFFGVRTRVPFASGWVYTAEGPQYIDGQNYYRAGDATGVISGAPKLKFTGIEAGYRKGKYSDFDDNFNVIPAYWDYGFSRKDEEYKEYIPYVCWNRNAEHLTVTKSPVGDPYTVVLDAYNKYGSVWREGDSNTPTIFNIDESADNIFFENNCQPKGSLSLFQTTNPDTGRVNVMPFNITTFPYFGLSGSLNLSTHAMGNPYKPGFSSSITVNTLVMTGTAGDGSPIYETKTQTKNILYAKFPIPVFPQMTGCAIWSIKIYDRDRLVRDLIPVAKGDLIYEYVMPENGLFDKVTEIFFGNSNTGGTYTIEGYLGNNQASYAKQTREIKPEEVEPLHCILDPTILGKTISNYYDYDNSFLGNQFVDVPTWFNPKNTTIEDILAFNDYKPDDFHLDGLLDIDEDLSFEKLSLIEIFEMGANNIYYKLRNFTKTIVYYRDNVRIASKDLFYSLEDIENAKTLQDLGIDVDLYYSEDFAHGRIVFDESIIAEDDVASFIDAPSPIVVYDKLSKEEAPNLLYVEYYRGGAYDDNLITIDTENPNYLNCDLTATVLNPHGAIKYYNHYHTALYEDEKMDYFIPYQVKVLNKYTGIHRGPARKYPTLAMIVERDTYTIIEERNGWGRLKEYPVGWILLNQTEPMTGPGQNPDYDVSDAETATIPFATKISINKMTIDRLWCYCPEVKSWIKNEDISFDQAGKLYNGLGIDVIHLDEVDFTNPTLTSIGIYPQKYKLRFHEFAEVPEIELTRDNLAAQHSLQFVYNETIYTYSCHYYKYHKAPYNELGTAAFSCSISDWNPDWDTFIATSYQQEEKIDYGYYDIRPSSSYTIIYKEPSTSSEVMARYQSSYTTYRVKIIGPRADDGWTLVETADGIKGYLKTSTGDIVKPYNGTHMAEKNPTLYRDTEITLDWSYFGFDRNLFKPDGFGDGIYLWNPRNWDKDNVKFTFNELITCGTQYVIYPVFNPDTYKLWVQRNYLGASHDFNSNNYGYAYNPGIKVNMAGSNNKFIPYIGGDYPVYDVYTSGEIVPPMVTTVRDSSGSIIYTLTSNPKAWNTSWYWYSGKQLLGQGYPYLQSNAYDSKQTELGNPEENDTFIWRFSNRDTSPTAVLGLGNEYINKEKRYYMLDKLSDFGQSKWTQILDNTNLQGYYIPIGTVEGQVTLDANDSAPNMYGVLYDTIIYENCMMIHYWVPVPKGLWYNYEANQLRMPDNGLFDLLTGEFARSYRLEDGQVTVTSQKGGYTASVMPTVDGRDLIFKRNQELNEDDAYNYFQDWDFQKSEVNYVVTAKEATYTYDNPDEYAPRVRKITSGLYMPVSAYTSDRANKVVGEWYFSGDQWILSSKTNMASWSTYNLNYRKEKQVICLVPHEGMSKFYTYLKPSANTWQPQDSTGEDAIDYGDKGQVIISYWTAYANEKPQYYYDGNSWIPVAYTHNSIREENKSYVVAIDTKYYQYPIEDNTYLLGTYLYGERITVLHSYRLDESWCYTGQGWLKKTSTNLSIIE